MRTDMKPGKLFYILYLLLLPVLVGSGCFKVGPNFKTPSAPVAKKWLEADDRRVKTKSEEYRCWWRAFNDPALDKLIATAYRENLTLRVAGVRVLEARAQLGIAIGEWFPQNQQAFGQVQRVRLSANSPTVAGTPKSESFKGHLAQTAVNTAARTLTASLLNPGGTPPTGISSSGTGSTPTIPLEYSQSNFGATASWELDFWGKFSRGIESADASLSASLADYDNALVSLTADVANAYILIRTLDKRLVIARQNVETQQESLKIAEARFSGGTTSERDVQQAKSQLLNTQASIPVLQIQLRQTKNALSVLLGMPPGHLKSFFPVSAEIPAPPPQVALSIPAELLRRRPDIRSAELQAMAQCAQIGMAKAELLPAFSLTGTFGFQSSTVGNANLGDTFQWRSRYGSGGPGFQWNLLNYGQITNQVRVQDARFQELLITYQSTVLTAQREVEDALVAFLRTQERAVFLTGSTEAAQRSLDLAVLQYRQGITDFTTVLTAQQALLTEQDSLANTLGDIAHNLVALYRALGGGWQIREGHDVVPEVTKIEMAKRTDWGGLLKPTSRLMLEPETPKPLLGVRPPDW
jgi:NodT family efflux transporter outer membrane factor (OMF) lipoprotein